MMKQLIHIILLGGVLILNAPEGRAQTLNRVAGFFCPQAFSPSTGKKNHLPIPPKKQHKGARNFQNNDVQKGAKQRALLQDPRLVFGENFRRGNIEGPNGYFIVKQMSFNPRIPLGRIIEKTSENSAVAEIIDPASGTVREINLQLNQERDGSFYLAGTDHPWFMGIIMQARPDMELVFSAIKSERKELSNKDWSLYPKNGKKNLRAQALKDKGYSFAYVRHMDEISQWQAFKRMIQEGGVNPYKTHIEYLAESIIYYINYIRQGIEQLSTSEIQSSLQSSTVKLPASSKLQSDAKQGTNHLSVVAQFKKITQDRLVELEKKVEKAIIEKQLTYQQFLKFITDLSNAVWYAPSSSEIKQNDIEALLEYFPIIIAVPVRGEVGIMALNESSPLGIHPLGLSYQMKAVDGKIPYTPLEFTRHDIFHAFASIRLRSTSFNTAHEQFHNRWIEYRESLPIEERKNVELAYYLLTHEDAYKPFVTNTLEDMQHMAQQILINKISQGHNFKGLKDFSQNKKERVSEVVHDWLNAFQTINTELGFL